MLSILTEIDSCRDQQHLYHTMSETKHAFEATNNANNKDEFHQYCLPDDILYRMMEEFESNVNEHSSRTDNGRIVLTPEENCNDDRKPSPTKTRDDRKPSPARAKDGHDITTDNKRKHSSTDTDNEEEEGEKRIRYTTATSPWAQRKLGG